MMNKTYKLICLVAFVLCCMSGCNDDSVISAIVDNNNGSGTGNNTDGCEKLGNCKTNQKCQGDACFSCDDGIQNGDETGIDCGGSCLIACISDTECESDADCPEGYRCKNDACVIKTIINDKPSCQDNIRNGDESDVDCGGSCNKCSENMDCNSNLDCMSDNCEFGTCKMKQDHCSDGMRSGDESDVDCGGSCNKCVDNMQCHKKSDCRSGNCEDGTCKTQTDHCSDGILSGDETDIDCGGSCNKCEENMRCSMNSDCLSNHCDGGTCKPKIDHCADGVRSDDETDVDCGGACPLCSDGKICNSGEDCASGFCDGNQCTSCDDGILNGDESDIDCGGRCGATCVLEKTCNTDNDCESYNCVSNICKSIDCSDMAETGDVIINEVFTNPDTEAKMEHSNNQQMKYIELYNKTDKTLQLYNLSLTYAGNEIHAKGCIPAKSYLVIHPLRQTLTALDMDAKTLASDNIESVINVISGNAKLVKRSDNTVIHSAIVSETPKGTAAGRDQSEDSSTHDEVMVPHSSVKTIESGVKNLYSPGLPNNVGFPMG